jgi:hypothetical protein
MPQQIQDQSLLYHLTSLSNLKSILSVGLLPRAAAGRFDDVADAAIIASRQRLGLQHRVPFHFFAKNPFDGRVQRDHTELPFVLIAVRRRIAREHGWKIIPRHPLAGTEIQIMSYDEGFAAIDWALMNKRDYSHPECKSVCMAECVAPGVVPPTLFSNLFVKNEAIQTQVQNLVAAQGLSTYINVNEKMFLK